MGRHTLSYIGFDEYQQGSISAILNLAEVALTDTWLLIREDSDIILFNISQEDGLAKLKVQENTPDNRVVYVGINDDLRLEPYWFLEKKESSPPSLRALVKLLNNISVFLAEKQEHNAATGFKSHLDIPIIKIEAIPKPKQDLVAELKILAEVGSLSDATSIPALEKDDASKLENGTETKTDDTSNDVSKSLFEEPSLQALQSLAKSEMIVLPSRKLSPKNYFFGLIQQVLTDKSCCVIKLYNLPAMYLCGKTGRYAYTGSRKHILQLCIAMPQLWTKKNLTVAQFEKQVLKQPELHLYALNDLYILSILFVGQGRLLDRQTEEQTILLKEAAFMDSPLLSEYLPFIEAMKEANTLTDIAKQLQVPISKVFDIYNVAYLLGTIDILEQPTMTMVEQKKQPIEANNKKNLGQLFISLFKK